MKTNNRFGGHDWPLGTWKKLAFNFFPVPSNLLGFFKLHCCQLDIGKWLKNLRELTVEFWKFTKVFFEAPNIFALMRSFALLCHWRSKSYWENFPCKGAHCAAERRWEVQQQTTKKKRLRSSQQQHWRRRHELFSKPRPKRGKRN